MTTQRLARSETNAECKWSNNGDFGRENAPINLLPETENRVILFIAKFENKPYRGLMGINFFNSMQQSAKIKETRASYTLVIVSKIALFWVLEIIGAINFFWICDEERQNFNEAVPMEPHGRGTLTKERLETTTYMEICISRKFGIERGFARSCAVRTTWETMSNTAVLPKLFISQNLKETHESLCLNFSRFPSLGRAYWWIFEVTRQLLFGYEWVLNILIAWDHSRVEGTKFFGRTFKTWTLYLWDELILWIQGFFTD